VQGADGAEAAGVGRTGTQDPDAHRRGTQQWCEAQEALHQALVVGPARPIGDAYARRAGELVQAFHWQYLWERGAR